MFPIFTQRYGFIDINNVRFNQTIASSSSSPPIGRCFGACEYQQRIYYIKSEHIYSIPSNVPLDKLTQDDVRDELHIPGYGFGAHQIVIINDKLYIQETFFNQISIYSFNEGKIDPLSRFVPSIYPNAVNGNVKINPELIAHNAELKQRVTDELIPDQYHHINSLCIHPSFPSILFCTSIYVRNQMNTTAEPVKIKNSTIDYIDMNTWTVTSYEVPCVAIHDLIYNPMDNLLYFSEAAHIYSFDPVTHLTNRVFTFDISLYNWQQWRGMVSRGLCIDDKGYMYYILVNGIPSNFRPKTINYPLKCILIGVDSKDWSLIRHGYILEDDIDTDNFISSSVKKAQYTSDYIKSASLPLSVPVPSTSG